MAFTKGQTLTFKKIGLQPDVKQFAGLTANVLRGGKNVSLAVPTERYDEITYEPIMLNVKVNNLVLAASIRKN